MRIEAGYARHPKILAAGPRLTLAHLRAMGWSAEHETGGRIPISALSVIPLSRREAESLADHRLLDRNGDGYHLHDWEAYQPTAEELAVERERQDEIRRLARERKAKERARKRGNREEGHA